ncbi:MAG: hypothetical protein KC443_21445, partial [Anaerolineales bacterium]|nr:hypothetical protein [Anaerolineales bacterium]
MAQGDVQHQLDAAQRQVRLLQAELDAAKQDLVRLQAEVDGRVAAQIAARETQLSHTQNLIMALGHVTTQIEAIADLDQILAVLGDHLKRLGLYCVVSLFDLPTQNLFIRYQSVDLPQLRHAEALAGLSMIGFQLTRENFPLLDDIVALEQPAFISDSTSLAQAVLPDMPPSFRNQLLAVLGITMDAAVVYLPLAVERRVLGVMTIWGETLQIDDVHVYSIFASQVAAVLEVGRLREQTQSQRIEEQDALLALSQTLLGLTDRGQVAQAITHVVQQLLDFDEVMLLLPDAEKVDLVAVGAEVAGVGGNGRSHI